MRVSASRRFLHACAHSRMAVRKVEELGAPVLRVIAEPVGEEEFGSKELSGLVDDLIDTMHDCNGAGIAAPQIGVSKRVFVAYGSGNNPRYPYKPAFPLTVFVNPVLSFLPPATDDEPAQLDLIEGCLSVPGLRGRVQRFPRVEVRARRVDGSAFIVHATGLGAGTMQHEFDHLEGLLFSDIAAEGGLMTHGGFEDHHKEEFFAHAMAINEQFPVPITIVDVEA